MPREDASINSRDNEGRTPLHYARGNAVSLLLARTDLLADAQDSAGLTPLMKAARDNRMTKVKDLLRATRKDCISIDVDARDADGSTALARVVQNVIGLSRDKRQAFEPVDSDEEVDLDEDEDAPVDARARRAFVQRKVEDGELHELFSARWHGTIWRLLTLFLGHFKVFLQNVLTGAVSIQAEQARRLRGFLVLGESTAEILRMLLVQGADVEIKDARGLSALDYASNRSPKGVWVKWLLRGGLMKLLEIEKGEGVEKARLLQLSGTTQTWTRTRTGTWTSTQARDRCSLFKNSRRCYCMRE